MSFLLCMKDFKTIFKNFTKSSPTNPFFDPTCQNFVFLVCGEWQRQFASLKTLSVDGPCDYTQFEKNLNRIEQ